MLSRGSECKHVIAARPSVIRLLGCEYIPPDQIQISQRFVASISGLNFGSTAGKKPEYQALPAPIEIKGVTVDKVLFTDNGTVWSYTFKLASLAEVQLLQDAFQMKKQKPTISKGDSIYADLYPNTMAERQASVNPQKMTFSCRWRSELSDEVE